MFAKRTGWNLEPNPFSRALERHRRSGKRLIDLTISNPTACGFVYDEAAILRAFQYEASLQYEPDPRGVESARRAVAAYYAERGAAVSADDIVLTTGTSEAYSFVFRLLCDAGDHVLVPEPSYPLLGLLADIEDVELVPYPLVYDGYWRIDFGALENSIGPRSRAIVVVNPNNPTGHYSRREESWRLAKLCARGETAIVADEVFWDFVLEGEPAPSFALSSAALTFTLSGLSKIAGLPQMKAAWIVVGGPEAMKKMALPRLEVIADTFLSMNTPIQLALPELLGTAPAFRRQVIERARRNLAELDRQIGKQRACERLAVEGGWYAVLRVPITATDEELAIRLVEEKSVAVHPGHFYDFSGEGYLVVSLIGDEAEFREGIRQVLTIF